MSVVFRIDISESGENFIINYKIFYVGYHKNHNKIFSFLLPSQSSCAALYTLNFPTLCTSLPPCLLLAFLLHYPLAITLPLAFTTPSFGKWVLFSHLEFFSFLISVSLNQYFRFPESVANTPPSSTPTCHQGPSSPLTHVLSHQSTSPPSLYSLTTRSRSSTTTITPTCPPRSSRVAFTSTPTSTWRSPTMNSSRASSSKPLSSEKTHFSHFFETSFVCYRKPIQNVDFLSWV